MKNRRLFVTVSTEGLDQLVSWIDRAISSDIKKDNGNNVALLLPPCFLQISPDENSDALDSVVNSLYSWIPESQVLNKDTVELLKCESDVSDDAIQEDDIDFITDCIHQFADELLISDSIFQVFIFTGNKDLEMNSYTNFIGALKRLEIWHHAFIGFVADINANTTHKVVRNDHNEWLKIINSEILSLKQLHNLYTAKTIWNGSMNLIFEKRSGYISIGQFFLQCQNTEGEMLFREHVMNNMSNISWDNHIEIVACVEPEELPLHMILPHKFTLFSFSDLHDRGGENFDFFKFCAEEKGYWLMAFLKYGKPTKKANTRKDWNEYISDDFTQHFCMDFSSMNYNQHIVLFLKKSRNESSLDAYFVYHRESLNANGFLKLLERVEVIDDNIEGRASKDSDLTFYPFAAEYLHPAEWCEKTSWYLEEAINNIGRSLSRCKSDDFFMNGVPIVNADTSKDDPKKNFLKVLSSFDADGKAVAKDLQPIPVISDRLLKNLKTEEMIKSMNFSEAEHEIGHGIDYCLDSLCSLRLDNRLAKVEKRYVPEDTLNLAVFLEKNDTEPEITIATTKKLPVPTHDPVRITKTTKTKGKSVKRTLSKTQLEEPKAKKTMGEKKESRSQKTTRRLRTFVEGVVYKYGGIHKDNEQYMSYCDQLFHICMVELKKLTSSVGLNDQMKQLAKDNLSKVVHLEQDSSEK